MATQDDLDQLDQHLQEHDDYRKYLQQAYAHITSLQPTGYWSYGRGLAQFNKDRQTKLLEIERQSKRSEQDYRDLARMRQATASKIPGAKQATPLSEAGQLTQLERERKQGQDIADQGPQGRLAKNQLEQQKAADAASIPALGASVSTKTGGAQPQTLRDLLTKFQMRPDRNTGEYVFSRPNDEGVLTPGQTRAGTQLTAAFKPLGLQPEEVFGTGVPAPVFDPKTGISVPKPGGNPFIGTQAQFNTLAGLYKAAQPSENTELRVPTGALDRAYQATAPAYGPTFPANPVDIDRNTPAAVALAGLGQPGEAGYVPRAPSGAVGDALLAGKAAADVDALSGPISMNLKQANPMVPVDTGGAPAAITPPKAAPVFGPSPATPEERAAIAPQILEGAAKQYGLSPGTLADIRARKLAAIQAGTLAPEDADAIEQRALEAESAKAKLAQVPEVAGAAGTVLGGFTPAGALKTVFNSGLTFADLAKQKMDEEEKKRQAAAALTGDTPLTYDELNPPGAPQ